MQDNGSAGDGNGYGAKATRAAGDYSVKPLPDLKENVKRVMFYCQTAQWLGLGRMIDIWGKHQHDKQVFKSWSAMFTSHYFVHQSCRFCCGRSMITVLEPQFRMNFYKHYQVLYRCQIQHCKKYSLSIFVENIAIRPLQMLEQKFPSSLQGGEVFSQYSCLSCTIAKAYWDTSQCTM